MPKIEVNENLFFNLLGKKYDFDTLEKKLTFAKAELDEKPDMSQPENERVIKIELNDTNRPDLWSTGGVTRQLRIHEGAKRSNYSSFLSKKDSVKDCADRVITVDPEMKNIRPYMVSFVISGKPIDDPMLKDIIQTQEKLCWNFGRKRRSISMGVYRMADIKWPCHYKAVDPDKTSFVPLQCEQPMTCRQILTEHPKGKDFGWIIKDLPKFPLLTDDTDEVLSMAPVINSATLGAVQVGDKDLMVELTGDNMENLMLSANIVACDFFDAGYEILPVKVVHPYETALGKEVVAPFYFQPSTKTTLAAINKKLGCDLTKDEVLDALARMDNDVSAKDFDASEKTASYLKANKNDVEFVLNPPPYRNDFLHEVDIIEDVMIGVGLDNFKPVRPSDFTVGQLSDVTLFSRKAKEIMVGLGYQEMIFNYLGSKRDYIDRMCVSSENVIEISNPMSENYQFVRPSIIASLLRAESQAGQAVFPHKIFEIGKVAFLDSSENTGTKTIQSLGFMTACNNANFNSLASEVSTLLYLLDHKYDVKEVEDPRFIPGRQAAIMLNGKQVGVFGEVHPQVLENWGIIVPCVAGEIDIEALMPKEKPHSKPAEKAKNESKPAGNISPAETDPAAYFNSHIELLVAKIEKVETNPQGDKLYVETMDDGSGTPRIIQSGLRPYLKEEELLGKHVIIAANLAPRKMKGVESRGMLLACDYTEDGKEKVELLTAPWASPGTVITLEGSEPGEKPAKIDIDKFCKVSYKIQNHSFVIAGKNALAAGKPVTTQKADNCDVE
ncbi:phenylalanyl-tRNA synthetase beta subunit [Treponema berlinense]|uniref:Phenylalanine--tRNA ligase beta subunit n=2 Tax=Treponema berlinense TaxID=225004 RepID=A0A1T4QAC0_9SPIR|nr:phenylalanine--tRNA ligase subunit beta [Treponema berlinense]SKA00471.1 phenylalanyl-tRNA synthetase beta subunit [Treponema berlinense]